MPPRVLLISTKSTGGGNLAYFLGKNGSAGAGKIRTCWDLAVTIGIPFSRWGAAPFVVEPIRFPIKDPGTMELPAKVESPSVHPFHLALQWRQQLNSKSSLNLSKIAAREGISRARVTQVMNLLKLPEVIQRELQCLPTPLKIESFSERRLRDLIASGDQDSQVQHWRKLVKEQVFHRHK